jgi:hypothetical protein
MHVSKSPARNIFRWVCIGKKLWSYNLNLAILKCFLGLLFGIREPFVEVFG